VPATVLSALATLAVARRHLEAKSQRLKIADWVLLTEHERTLVLSKNTDRLQQLE